MLSLLMLACPGIRFLPERAARPRLRLAARAKAVAVIAGSYAYYSANAGVAVDCQH